MSLGYQCRALTQLGSQNFDIRLEIESQVGTPILQTLKASLRLTQEKIENHFYSSENIEIKHQINRHFTIVYLLGVTRLP